MSTVEMIIKPSGIHPKLFVELSRYTADNSIAVQTYAQMDRDFPDLFEPYARLSVCVEGCPPAENCFWFKDYSENSGLLDAALESGFGKLTGRSVISGYEIVKEFELNPAFVSQVPDVLAA